MKIQNYEEQRGSSKILIRYIINMNALSKDFTPFCGENCKIGQKLCWPKAMVNENEVCTFYILFNMQAKIEIKLQ